MFKISFINPAIFLVIFLAIGFLFYINQQAKSLDEQVKAMNRAIAQERTAISILEKEWQYLTVPDKILKKAERFLPHLQPANTDQIIALSGLGEALNQ